MSIYVDSQPFIPALQEILESVYFKGNQPNVANLDVSLEEYNPGNGFGKDVLELREKGFVSIPRIVNHELLDLGEGYHDLEDYAQFCKNGHEVFLCMKAEKAWRELEDELLEELEFINNQLSPNESRAARRKKTYFAKQRKQLKYPMASIQYFKPNGEVKKNRFVRHQIPQNVFKPKPGDYIDCGQRRQQEYRNRYLQLFDAETERIEELEIEFELDLEDEERRELIAEGYDPWDYDNSCGCEDYCSCEEPQISHSRELRTPIWQLIS